MTLKNQRSSPLKDIICLWTGLIADIPEGWQICDGSNGSPDLRCRIVTDKNIRNFYPFLEGAGLHAFDMGPTLKKGLLTANVTWLAKGVTIAAAASRIASAAMGGFNLVEGSIEMLVKPSWNNADNAYHFLWDSYGGSNRRFLLVKTSANLTEVYTDDTSRGSFTFAWTAGTTYHIVLNYGTNALYINKVLVKTYSAGTLGLGASTLYIGDCYAAGTYAFKGDIYYFIARDTPLTQAQIDAQYALLVEEKAILPIIKV
jgi:hypothetical protein